MADSLKTDPDRSSLSATRAVSDDLVELVDAVVAAIDCHRSWELERVAAALEPLGCAAMFADEVRLNGTASPLECPCRAEGWL